MPTIEIEINEDIQTVLEQAILLSVSESLASFMRDAAIEKAERIINNSQEPLTGDDEDQKQVSCDRSNVIKLTEAGALCLLEMLEAPPEPNKHLKEAFKHYREVVSKN